MRTVSTKLEKRDHERFVNLCNKEGCCISEALRDMVEQWCNANEDDVKMEKEVPKPIVTIIKDTPKPIVTIVKTATKFRTFNCSNGFLYENGILVGNCSDYNLRHGDVYDKQGKHLGTIER